jgi:outer membrane receptor protein involved in Fe transport
MKPMLALLCLFAATTPALAQRILGEFTGTVMDPSERAISGAKVTAREAATGRSWNTRTSDEGVYRLGSLPAGTTYEITFEAAGFKSTRQETVPLDVGEVRRVDVMLQVGQVTESVTVVGESSALNLEKGEVSAVVNQRAVVDLPLNGRNVYQLAELQAGVVRVAGSGLQESETTDAQVGASGTRFRDNQILLDGVTNNNDRQGGRTTLSLSPDAVEQFRVVTNNLSAEFGRSGGALISVITRSGSNEPHGSLFWFLRNDNLDASNTFEARTGQPEFKRNHFGATLGGPVIKNKTFFFFSYQGLRQIRPALRQFTLETPEFRDFVVRTRPNLNSARLLRDFPPINYPTLNIRDIGSPAPGVRVFGPPDGIPDVGEGFLAISGTTNDNQYSGRVDHTFNGGKDTITGRYSINDRKEVRPGDNSARVFVADFFERDQNVAINHSHIFSPSIINDLRLGWNYDPQITTGNNPEIPYIQANVAGRSMSYFSQTFGYVFPLDFRLHTYQVYDSVSINRGRHGIKLGGDFRAFQENSDFAQFTNPLIQFEDIFDFADDEVLSIQARVDPATGKPLGTYRNFRQKEWALFVQDDWKVTPRLTLNLGLRYDNFGTLKEKNGIISTLVFSSPNLAEAKVTPVKELFGRDNNNFAPRIGFAWDPTGSSNWSIRGGAGIFYSRVWTNFSGNSRFNTPFSMPVTLSALTPGQDPRSAYKIPFVGDPAFARPVDEFGGSRQLRPTVQTIDPTLRTPYNMQWNLAVQRRLPGNWVAEANYLGTAGRKLLIRNEINRFNGDRADGLVNRVHQSFAGITHGYNAVSSNYHALAVQASRRFAQGYYVQAAYTFSRSIDADSEPFGGGAGELQGFMDVNNLRLDRGLSAFDASHRLALNGVWEVPFLRARKDALGAILGGWQVNGIVSLQSGFPFTAVTSEDYNLDGVFTDRPNAVRAMPRVVGDGPKAFLDGVFGDIASWNQSFLPATTGTNGTLGRNTFRGPGYASVDASFFKDFRIPFFTSDGSTLQFRAEFFNLFNRVNLRSPGNSLGAYAAATGRWSNVNFGRSTLAFDGRQIQLALKWRF